MPTRALDSRGPLLAAALAILAMGCATPAPKRAPAVFFPQAPDPPRVQFLEAFRGSKDVEQQSKFDRFVVGEKTDVRLDKPYGIGIYNGRIYVCDTNATVVVFDLKAKTFGTMKGAIGPGKLVQPINISIEPDGTKYVADPVRGQVVVFDAKDEYVRAYGTPGGWRPVDVAPFAGRVYVVDGANAAVKVFDQQSGELVKTIGDKGEAIERLNRPTNIAFDKDGDLYVSDIGRFQVVKYDRDGHFKSGLGKAGDNLGHFARPKGIAVDREGHLFVADAAFNNVQIFDRDGRLLMFFGGNENKPGSFLLPAKVALDYDNLQYFRDVLDPNFDAQFLILVTGQFGDRLINVFAFGKQRGVKYPSDEELRKLIEERRRKDLAKPPAAPTATPPATAPVTAPVPPPTSTPQPPPPPPAG